jgi:hypothetical protein
VPVYPYDGIWTGGSFVGELTTTTTPGENADYGTPPVTTSQAFSIDGIYLGIMKGAIEQLSGVGNDGTFNVNNVDVEGIKISSTGLATGLLLDVNPSASSAFFQNCDFSLQFQSASQATSVGQLSCSGTDGYGTPASLTGTFILSRT